MQTEIKAYVETKTGIKVITIFGYATRGVPGIEIIGLGKLSKNLKEKIIYVTRVRGLKIPTKRFCICIDQNDFDDDIKNLELKWLEFPILLVFWFLAGLIPIRSLEDCLCTGFMTSKGEIFQRPAPQTLRNELKTKVNPVEIKELKLISNCEDQEEFLTIDSELLLGHIKNLKFKSII